MTLQEVLADIDLCQECSLKPSSGRLAEWAAAIQEHLAREAEGEHEEQ